VCFCMYAPDCVHFRLTKTMYITVYIWKFWWGNHKKYSHIRCMYTGLDNPMYIVCLCMCDDPYIYCVCLYTTYRPFTITSEIK